MQPIGTQPQPTVQEPTPVPPEQGALPSVAVSLPQPSPVAEPTATEGGVSQGGAQEQVCLEVIGTDALVMIVDTLLDEATDQDANLSMPKAEPQMIVVEPMSSVSRVREYLRRRLLAPVTRSPSI